MHTEQRTHANTHTGSHHPAHFTHSNFGALSIQNEKKSLLPKFPTQQPKRNFSSSPFTFSIFPPSSILSHESIKIFLQDMFSRQLSARSVGPSISSLPPQCTQGQKVHTHAHTLHQTVSCTPHESLPVILQFQRLANALHTF